MANVTVIGAQWGDEGKGKIVDWLASRADMVVRFQGGHNAGHTLVVEGETYKLSLLPSGIVTGTPSVIGNGVVLDPWALQSEVERIRGQGVKVTPDVLMLAETCPLILPIHRDLDALREDASGAGKIGTTRRGIGPAYEDKVGRRAIRVCDLAHLDQLEPMLDRLLIALDMGLDAAIRAVAHPACHAQRTGPLLSPGAEEHALDSAGQANVASNLGHRLIPTLRAPILQAASSAPGAGTGRD